MGMNVMKGNLLIHLLLLLAFFVGCSSDDTSTDGNDSFDRAAMLTFWADEVIMPGFAAYVGELETLNESVNSFVSGPDQAALDQLRADWLDAYLTWQRVSMFEIGKAEEITLRNYTNVYPLNSDDLLASLLSGDYDLASVNKQDEQGFPAIEFLIYGLEETDQLIIDHFLEETVPNPYATYLTDLSNRLYELAKEVQDDWSNGYKDTFVGNSGSSATSSVNKLVNDLLFYYEKHLRAGKIGIPAGVFSGSPLNDRVEALYADGHSKALFMEALDAYQDFFNGVSANGTSGESLADYLDFVNAISDGEELSGLIDAQFNTSRSTATQLSDDFEAQVLTDNSLMLATYDELQKNVVYMKVDMLQALNISVDFVDADGD